MELDQNFHAARACEDAAITALGGGDYDGDDIHVAADSDLIRLIETTSDGRGHPLLEEALEEHGPRMNEESKVQAT